MQCTRLSLGTLLLALLVGSCTKSQTPSGAEGRLEDLAHGFVDRLVKGEYGMAAAGFDDTMSRLLPAEKLEGAWKQTTGDLGKFVGRLGTRRQQHGQLTILLVTCRFEKQKLTVKVVFNQDREISGLWFSPAEEEYQAAPYVKKDSFRCREVTVGGDPWKLPGTLCLPVGDGRFPGLVLVHGSGPNDRDETVGANKPFRDLAEGLASRGIAVLRYDKRTKVHGSRMKEEEITTREEVLEDALAAVELLHKSPHVDRDRVFVLGHSLGGTLAPRIGKLDSAGHIAGLVIMAGATRRFEDLVWDQSVHLLGNQKELTDEQKKKLAALKRQVQNAKKTNLPLDTPKEDLPLGVSARYLKDLHRHHPPTLARKLPHRMLILQGGRDYQVTRKDFAGWKKGLKGKDNVQFKLYPKLNHLFIEGQGRSGPGEYNRPGHVAARVVEDISGWLLD